MNPCPSPGDPGRKGGDVLLFPGLVILAALDFRGGGEGKTPIFVQFTSLFS